jgi:hypothetical protein
VVVLLQNSISCALRRLNLPANNGWDTYNQGAENMRRQRSRLCFPFLALTVLVIVSMACGETPTSAPKVSTATQASSDGSTEPSKTDVPADTPEPAATETQVPELFLGDAVSNYGCALTGVSVQDPATPGMLYESTSGKKLIAVEIIVSNLSDNVIGINPLNATLVDAEGFTYDLELGGRDNQLSTVDLNPGERVKGMVAFEVPEKAVAASIKYAIESFGGKTLQARLTPAPEGHAVIPEPPLTPIDPLPKLGDVVENFGYSLSAGTVEDPATPGMLYTSRNNYKLVAVEITLGNVSGDEALSVNPLYTYLVDSNGFVYAAELGGRDDQIDTGDLGVGEKTKGWVSFTIPEDATPASIKYQTKVFSENYLQTGLIK